MPLRTVGVLGDVHCDAVRVATALACFRAERVDAVLAVGDLVDGPGDVNRALELLENHDVLAVAGNHERWLFGEALRELPHASSLRELSDEGARYLRSLPPTRDLDTVGGLALLCHGLGAHDMAKVEAHDQPQDLAQNAPLQELLQAGRYAYVINGHTHSRLVRRIGALTLINAGTLLEGDDPCCLVVDFERESVRVFDLADPTVARPAEVLKMDAWGEVF